MSTVSNTEGKQVATIQVVQGSPLDHDCPMRLCGKKRGVPCIQLKQVPVFHLERKKLTRIDLYN